MICTLTARRQARLLQLSAPARKFGDVFGRRTPSLLAASRRPSDAETEGCVSSNSGVSEWTTDTRVYGGNEEPALAILRRSRDGSPGR